MIRSAGAVACESGALACESNGLPGFAVGALPISKLESSCSDAGAGHSSDDFESMGLPSYQHLRPSIRRQDQYPCEFDGIAGLHCCFANAVGTTPGKNAPTTQAASPTELICFLIRKDYSLLQSTHRDHQIGPFENFHQLVEDTLVIVGSRLKVFLQNTLGFADGLKSQLLISHRFLPIRWRRPAGKWKIKPILGIIPSTFVSGVSVVFAAEMAVGP